jgi:hypothetical protein
LVGVSVNDHTHGLPDAVTSTRAGRDNSVIRSLGTGFDSDNSRGSVTQECRDGEGGYLCTMRREKRSEILYEL